MVIKLVEFEQTLEADKNNTIFNVGRVFVDYIAIKLNKSTILSIIDL